MDNQLRQQLEDYAAGRLSRVELQEASGLNFFEVLEGLKELSLKLPRVDTTARYNDAQKVLYNSLFANKPRSKHE
jgi:hypothetical protein